MGERQTGLAMRRSLGRWVIRRGPRQLRFVKNTEVLLYVIRSSER